MPIDSHSLTIVALTFLLAGIVKGIVGMGFSSVSLAVLTVTFGLQPAMVLQLAPSFVTHVGRAVCGAHTWATLARLWLFLLAVGMAIQLGLSLSYAMRMWALLALFGLVLADRCNGRFMWCATLHGKASSAMGSAFRREFDRHLHRHDRRF